MKEYRIKVNGTSYHVVVEDVNGTPSVTEVAPTPPVTTTPSTPEVMTPQPTTPTTPTTPPATNGEGFVVKSPLPGTIFEMSVQVGQQVTVGQKLLVIDAMKMENNLVSEKAGTIRSIQVNKGDSIVEGDVLLVIDL